MVQVLIGVLVVALAVIIGLFVYQRQTLKRLADLEQRLAALKLSQIDTRLGPDKVKALMGESLKSFTELRERFDQKLQPAVKKAKEQTAVLSNEAKTTALFKINGAVKDLAAQVQKVEAEYQRINQALDQLDAAVKDQTAALIKLRKTYNDYGRKLDEEAFAYGESKAALHDRLVSLEEKFERFATIANQGDHEAAQEILDDLKAETAVFADLLDTVPQLYKPLYTTYPDQLSELANGYQQLKQEHYNFSEADLLIKIQDLAEEQKFALEKLATLEIAPVKAANEHLAPAIDHLYEVMQKELDARPQVAQLLTPTLDHLAHAEQQNRQLLNELDKLSLSYTLNHNEMADARGLNEQLRQLRAELTEAQQAVDAQTAVDSQVLKQLQAAEEELAAIEKQQTEINHGVAGLQEDEQRAQKALQRFAVTLKTTKRRVESLNLPGIPQAYLDYFFVVAGELKKLSQAMDRPQIDMEEITKQLLMVQEDLQTLQEKTDELRDSAELTERMIQYAHRLSVDHESIEAAIQKAQTQFDQYEYTASLETIGTAIEEAEPGAFKRLEQSYFDEVDHATN
ncbi:septation ring formation regulator EzrA [Limosilactobacillus ingluviei]|uniref:septation ring formation regulator EzrA n=1 Tax=Limosilactobacillus ingluviei TaxID=148604 RepID=UPI0023EF7E2F|nr:septation ring formation regulator EzrA [Limosilactobacillus ingluviei]